MNERPTSGRPADARPPASASTTTNRTAFGIIPGAWARPAEASLPQAPAAEPRKVVRVALLAAGAGLVALAVVLAWTAPEAPPTARPKPAVVVRSDAPPPPPSRTPTMPPRPSRATGGVPLETTAEPPTEALVIKELPARRKARGLVERAEELLAKGDLEKAHGLLDQAAALDPDLPEAWRALGIVRAQLNDSTGARQAYERYVALAPDAPEADRMADMGFLPDVRRILGQ